MSSLWSGFCKGLEPTGAGRGIDVRRRVGVRMCKGVGRCLGQFISFLNLPGEFSGVKLATEPATDEVHPTPSTYVRFCRYYHAH